MFLHLIFIYKGRTWEQGGEKDCIMGFFDLFGSKSKEDQFRSKIREGFDKIVRDALRDAGGDPVVGGMLVHTAIYSFYNTMNDNYGLRIAVGQEGVNYDRLLDEERDRALRKYLR